MYQFDATISSAVEVAGPRSQPGPPAGPLDDRQLELIQRYWQAANYLTVGQIYLLSNALLHEPLQLEHIKPRLLGHWGTSPGLSFIYVHLNRLIRERDASVIYLAGPGHGGPALLANVYLESTYSEIYPNVPQNEAGLNRLFRQFSTPGGVPSHVSVPTPGSIHEGGELGYVLSHALPILTPMAARCWRSLTCPTSVPMPCPSPTRPSSSTSRPVSLARCCATSSFATRT